MKKITTIAKKAGLDKKYISTYGDYMAKVDFTKINSNKKGKLILVTATSPTPYGEGKTTMSIGLLDSLRYLGVNAMAALREPSLGPVFGIKGGATGGGKVKVLPSEEINLHFTGDFHAITSANNLICAAIDNHIHQGNEMGIDPDKIMFHRCLDVNDRALKNITIHGKNYERKEEFTITAASELMAIICLAEDYDDLRKRLDRILVAFDNNNKPIYLKEFNITGSLMVLLKDVLKPNLVQTSNGNPALISGGPFANIAHGCNSIIATKTALKLSDYVVTEAGFGSDCGAEKFFDIKCRKLGVYPDYVVLVTTIRALKHNGEEDLVKGLSNLQAHLDILSNFSNNILVLLNKFDNDTKEDINVVKEYLDKQNIEMYTSTSFKDGQKGCLDIANRIITGKKKAYTNKELYKLDMNIKDKVEYILKNVYKVGKINYTEDALEKIKLLEDNKITKYPICVAKTQYSISDDPKKLGYPKDYEVTVRDVKIYNGAGFITIFLGNIIAMPGLNKDPNYKRIDYVNNEIIGV